MSHYDAAHIEIKSSAEIDIMRMAGQILDEILIDLLDMVEAGVTTWDLEMRARQIFREKKVEPAFWGYKDYPAALCTSVNEEVVHGIPSPRKFLKSGDLLKIDAGLYYGGFYVDAARTVGIGDLDETSRNLMDTAIRALDRGIKAAVCGNRLGDISHAIQKEVESAGFSVVREYTGHGIGRKLHEAPQVPNFGPPHSGPRLKTGMVFALEPMVNEGGWETRVLDDQWTVITLDRKRSTHYEHTIVVKEEGAEILTKLSG